MRNGAFTTGRNICNSRSRRNARLPVRRAQNLQILRQGADPKFCRPAIEPCIQRRATEGRTDHLVELLGCNLQLRRPHDRIDARIDERRQCYRPGNRDAVLQVRPHAEVAAWENDLIHRNWHGPVSLSRIGRIFRTGVPSGFVRVMTFELGKNATGDIDRISKPRMSFSPPIKKRWNGGATRFPYPLMNDPLIV